MHVHVLKNRMWMRRKQIQGQCSCVEREWRIRARKGCKKASMSLILFLTLKDWKLTCQNLDIDSFLNQYSKGGDCNNICQSLVYLNYLIKINGASQVALVVKNPPGNAGDIRDAGWIPRLGRFPWIRAWQPTPVFLPGESHGQRSLEGYGPQGHKELNTTK